MANGILIGPREDQIAYRVGGVVNVNVLGSWADQSLGLGVALGAGVTTESEVVSDLFVAGVVSARDVIRIGLGVGASRFPSSVKGLTVGQAFDPNAGKLKDLVETSMKRAFHIIFVLPGIKL